MAQAAISELVRQMTPVRYTVKEAARKTGISEDTLTRWRKTAKYVPSDARKFGELLVWLYSDEDIVALKRMAKG